MNSCQESEVDNFYAADLAQRLGMAYVNDKAQSSTLA